MTVTLIRKGKSGIPEDRIVNLLQINGNHVCYITGLILFLKAFFHLKKNKEICVLCLVQFKNKTEIDDHITSKVCHYNTKFTTKIILPPPNSICKFKSLGKTLRPLLVCYANSESILIPNEDNTRGILNTHKMISFAYVILNGITGKILSFNLIFGDGTSKRIVPTLRQEYFKQLAKVLDNEVDMYLTEKDEYEHNTTARCQHCDVLLTWDAPIKTRGVRHHDHFKQPIFTTDENGKRELVAGNYFATICSGCNLLLTNKRSCMKVKMHNGGGYDFSNFLCDVEPKKGESVFILPK